MRHQVSIHGAFAVASFLVMWTPAANAALYVRVTSGATTYTVEDGSTNPLAFDHSPQLGGVTLLATDAFNISAVSATSKPLAGNDTSPWLQIHVQNRLRLGTGPAELTIEVTDTDFRRGLDPQPFSMWIDSSIPATSTVTYTAWVDTGNLPFGLPDADEFIGTIGPVTGDIHKTEFGLADTHDRYSMTAKFTIRDRGPEDTSFVAGVKALPEPTTLGIWGVLGCIFAGSRVMLRRWRK